MVLSTSDMRSTGIPLTSKIECPINLWQILCRQNLCYSIANKATDTEVHICNTAMFFVNQFSKHQHEVTKAD